MTYNELCNKNIGDMNKEELFEFAHGLLDEVHDFEKKIESLNTVIDELVLECYKSSLGLGEFARIWKMAFNEDYEPTKIDKLKELKVYEK